MRILFAGQVGESLPPPYAGVPKRALLLAKLWQEMNNAVGICFTYRHDHEDDLGANATYFFEYSKKPTTQDKIYSLIRSAIRHPVLYSAFVGQALRALGPLHIKDSILFAAYGVFLDGVVNEFKPEILVAESGLHRSFFAAQVARRRKVPFVLETYAEVHDHSIMRFKDEAARARFWKGFFALCDRIIAPSEYCAIGPRTYAPPGLVHMVFATTLNVAQFTDDHRTQAEGRAQLQLPSGEFIVAAVGSFSPRKGHDHIIEAAAELHKKGLPIGVMLCGEGDPTWLRALAEKHGITESVHIFQNLSESDLRLLFRSADVYCDASNSPRACLGIALTEALATGIPAIAYDVAGLPEVVRDGETGYLVPVDDIRALAATLEKLYYADPQERARLGANGLTRAQEVFDIHQIANQLLTELSDVRQAHVQSGMLTV